MKGPLQLITAVLLAMLCYSASADPFTPKHIPSDSVPIYVLQLNTGDGLEEFVAVALIGYCGGDPVNRIDPMGTDYIYEQNGYVFYQGQKMSGGKGKGNNFRRDAGKPVAIGTTDGTYIKLFQGVGGGIVHQATFERAAVQTLSGAATCAGINAVIQRAYGMDAPSATPGYDRAIAFTQGVRTTSIVAGTVVAVAATGGAAATAYTAYGTTGVLAVGAQTTTQVAVGVGTAVVAKSGLEAVGVPEDFAQPLSEATSLGVTYKASGLINSLIPIKSYVNNVEITGTAGPLPTVAMPQPIAARIPTAGDSDFIGPIIGRNGGEGWRLSPRGDGAHLVERVNVEGRAALSIFDTRGTLRFYPNGSVHNAGAAHARLHDATRAAGIDLQGGNSAMSNAELLSRYASAYSNPELQFIHGSLRTPTGKVNWGDNLTPSEAFNRLMQWQQSQSSGAGN